MAAKKKPVTIGPPTRNVPASGFVKKKSSSGQGGGGCYGVSIDTPNPPPYPGNPEGNRETGTEAVMSSWRLLSYEDRKHCLALMSLEQQQASPGDVRDVDLWSGAVHEAFVARLGASDGAAYGPQVVRRVMGAPAAWGPVAEFLTAARLQGLKPAEKYAVFRLLAELIVSRADAVAVRAGIPLTLKMAANNAQHVAAIFDRQFPGYVSAGLAHIVAKQIARGTDHHA